MGYRQKMQKGSFRGVPFRVKSQETELGRRVARHEYPGRDDPWPEDLGKKGRVHTLEMHIIGADYMAGRDAMIAALEKAGPAELVHPWLGRLQVQVEASRLRESTREGGMAIFSVSFLEAAPAKFPSASASTPAAVDSKATPAAAAVSSEFSASFSVSSRPAWVALSAISTLTSAMALITTLVHRSPATPEAMTAFDASLLALQTALPTLVYTPAALAGQTSGLIQSVAGLYTDPADSMQVYRDIAAFSVAAVVPTTTPARTSQAANQNAIIDLISGLAVIGEARASRLVTPPSSADALRLRDDLAERLDTRAAAADDDVYLTLTDLRSAVVIDLTDRSARLPNISLFMPPATIPALVLAHRIYGDAGRDDEIVSRNHIRHPGFVPGGSALEVLHG